MAGDVHFLTYDPDEMWAAGVQAYMEAGGNVLYPGDEKEMHLRGVQNVILLMFAGVDTALRMATLTDAVGSYLDMKGEDRLCPRIEASPAVAKVRISFKATGKALIIPAGAKMTADGMAFYAMVEAVEHTGLEQETDATVACVTAGVAGNGVPAGTVMRFVDGYAAVVKVTTTEASWGGQEREDDDTYRERIRQYGLASVTTGPASQYEAIARGVSTEVLDAKAVNSGAGQVKIYVILRAEEGAQSVLQQIETACAPEDARPLTDLVTAEVAQGIPYHISLSYKLPENATSGMTNAIGEKVNDYIEWQNNTLGRAFTPEMLISGLYGAGAVRVVLNEDSHFNNGACEYTEIDPGQRCAGTVTVGVLA